MTPDKKTKKKNILTAVAILAFMVFLFVFTLYNVGVFDRQLWWKKKTLTPVLLGGIFFLMLGLSFAAVPLYDMFCRITGFGGTTQVSKEAPNIVLDKVVSVRFDTNVNNLTWDFKAKSNVIDVKVGQVNRIEFEVENYGDETTYGVASFNVSPSSFGKYYSKLGCFCFEKQELKAGEKATFVMTFYLDPELVNDPTTKNLQDVTMSYTFFSTDYYKQS